MPVHWLIDSRSRRVVVTADGRVTRAEFEEYLEAVAGAGANAYAKIFGGTLGKNAADRRLRLFMTLRAARAWLDVPATERCDA